MNSQDNCNYANNNDNSHSVSSNNCGNIDLELQDNDPFIENQLKAFENYDCLSVCTDFESNKIYNNNSNSGNNKRRNSMINQNLSNLNHNNNTDFETNFSERSNVLMNENKINKNLNTNELNQCENIKSNDFKDVLHNQRRTIINLAQKYKKIESALFNYKKENNEKENDFSKSTNMKIKEYENSINNYEEKIAIITKEYEDYKIKALEDFAYKEKKLMDLINKISDLEDENFRIIHNNKDTDKKKYLLMEKKTKDLTLELQKVNIFLKLK